MSASASPSPKSFLTCEDLADLLINRNLVADKNELIQRLSSVSYYRLTGYLYPFRETLTLPDGSRTKGENYRNGTTLEIVWKYYLFDRRLRFLLLDAIERIEIALRAQIAHRWAKTTGSINPQAHKKSYNKAFIKKKLDEKLLEKMQESYDRSSLDCVIHHKNKGITEAKNLPIWVLMELTTIGELVWVFGGLKETLQKDIAAHFGFTDADFFASVLTLIHRARNVCAHHSRVWNASWQQYSSGSKKSSQKTPHWRPIVKSVTADWLLAWDSQTSRWQPQPGTQSVKITSTAFLLMACNIFLKQVAHTSSWLTRFKELMSRPETPYQAMIGMGLPKHWREHPFFN